MDNDEQPHVSRRPKDTAFRQQRMRVQILLITPYKAIAIFLTIGLIFIPLGAGFLFSSQQAQTVSWNYDDCPANRTCLMNFTIPERMLAPVYFYYQLSDFYQNHRRYVSSRDDVQLRGKYVDPSTLQSSCMAYWSLYPNDKNPQAADTYLPCGLIASSQFNDTFELYGLNESRLLPPIPLQKQGIAWSSDVNKKFKNPSSSVPGIRLISDFQDEDFVVWMQVAGLPTFKKLHRIINQDLPAGEYSVNISSNFPVQQFGGHKTIVLSTVTWMGGRNNFIGGVYLGFGILCLLQGIFFVLRQRFSPRGFADKEYLNYNK